MKQSIQRLAAAASLALLAACAAPPETLLQPGRSTEADVRASQGTPTRVWPQADGGRTLQYATQPFGKTCWQFRIGADGRLLALHDALSSAAREQVVPGLTPEAVSRLLCAERRRETYALSGEEVWDWTVPSDSASDGLRFNVHFLGGRVVRTSYSLVLREKPPRVRF